jgi:hypothetical protein
MATGEGICTCGPEWRNPDCDQHGNANMACVHVSAERVAYARRALLAIRSHLDAVCQEPDRSIDIDHILSLVAEGLGEAK